MCLARLRRRRVQLCVVIMTYPELTDLGTSLLRQNPEYMHSSRYISSTQQVLCAVDDAKQAVHASLMPSMD